MTPLDLPINTELVRRFGAKLAVKRGVDHGLGLICIATMDRVWKSDPTYDAGRSVVRLGSALRQSRGRDQEGN
jgi:hypothetical protein